MSESLPEAVINEINAGRKVRAIKALRQAKGIGLKEAKVAVDAYIAAHPHVQANINDNAPSLSIPRLIQLLVFIALVVAGYYFFNAV